MSERASTQEQSIYLRHLLDEVRKNSHPVFLEGAYQVQTSSGQPLTIEVITQKGVIENNDDFYFFAFDEDGKLVGHRYTHLVLYEGAYEVGGMIVTRIRQRVCKRYRTSLFCQTSRNSQ